MHFWILQMQIYVKVYQNRTKLDIFTTYIDRWFNPKANFNAILAVFSFRDITILWVEVFDRENLELDYAAMLVYLTSQVRWNEIYFGEGGGGCDWSKLKWASGTKTTFFEIIYSSINKFCISCTRLLSRSLVSCFDRWLNSIFSSFDIPLVRKLVLVH